MLACGVGCQALTDPNIEYVECLPDGPPGDYEEDFKHSWQETVDRRCWRSDNLEGATVQSGGMDEELLLRPSGPATWSPTSQAPLLYRRVAGDFAVFARVEAAQGQADQCPGDDDWAGLLVRSIDRRNWAALLTQPAFPPDTKCLNDAKPLVRVRQSTHGFSDQAQQNVGNLGNLGNDGEVDIFICRLKGRLSYAVGNWGASTWLETELDHSVSTDTLDVGVTTSSSVGGAVEGHFAWARFLEDLPSDGCQGAMDRVAPPEQP